MRETELRIELTEEWLVKLGFEKHEVEAGNSSEGYFYTLKFSENKYCDLSLLCSLKKGKWEAYLFPYENFKFHFLHQLKNIYFDLTGEVLKISE